MSLGSYLCCHGAWTPDNSGSRLKGIAVPLLEGSKIKMGLDRFYVMNYATTLDMP